MNCNDGYVCELDIITYEPIDDPDNCLAIDNEHCTTCDSAGLVRNSNYKLFNDNPLKAIFGVEGTKNDTDNFWKLLEKKCKLQRPSTSSQDTDDFYIAEPEFDELLNCATIVENRIQEYSTNGLITNINASNFIRAIYRVADSLKGVHFKKLSEPKEYIRNLFKNILRTESCSSQIIHDPIELPLSIQLLMCQLSIASKTSFIRVVKFLDSQPAACLEAVIEKCIQILNKFLKTI